MINQKKISVIITCYNLEKYISRAINSCINQTLSDEKYEIISSSHPEPGMAKDMITGREFNHILEGEDTSVLGPELSDKY